MDRRFVLRKIGKQPKNIKTGKILTVKIHGCEKEIPEYKENHFPKKDKYIPDAVFIADQESVKNNITVKCKNKEPKPNRYHPFWIQTYFKEMDRILSKKKLRVVIPESEVKKIQAHLFGEDYHEKLERA